jgi:hypothetical protein
MRGDAAFLFAVLAQPLVVVVAPLSSWRPELDGTARLWELLRKLGPLSTAN